MSCFFSDHTNGFWFGTQDLNCLKGKGLAISKRSADAPEVSTIQYVHRLIYYNGTIFEWGNGVRGYYYGTAPAAYDCPVMWEEEPAGTSSCRKEIIELFTREYRAHYGGYNLALNNCHHFVNRVSIILTSGDCNIGRDKWSEFSDTMWNVIRRFIAVFERGTIDRPQDIQRAASRDPSVHKDWPIVKWY